MIKPQTRSEVKDARELREKLLRQGISEQCLECDLLEHDLDVLFTCEMTSCQDRNEKFFNLYKWGDEMKYHLQINKRDSNTFYDTVNYFYDNEKSAYKAFKKISKQFKFKCVYYDHLKKDGSIKLNFKKNKLPDANVFFSNNEFYGTLKCHKSGYKNNIGGDEIIEYLMSNKWLLKNVNYANPYWSHLGIKTI